MTADVNHLHVKRIHLVYLVDFSYSYRGFGEYTSHLLGVVSGSSDSGRRLRVRGVYCHGWVFILRSFWTKSA
jgi:hypothetical protein